MRSNQYISMESSVHFLFNYSRNYSCYQKKIRNLFKRRENLTKKKKKKKRDREETDFESRHEAVSESSCKRNLAIVWGVFLAQHKAWKDSINAVREFQGSDWRIRNNWMKFRTRKFVYSLRCIIIHKANIVEKKWKRISEKWKN